ncbi:hypothetical protein K402DRAFT_415504 [Aulographum hederae CBS 113979]|uniref:Aminoglycoside phosphotransferase domain-containing protein n=1 Tax=Aulographum hederae CBS 113979 TaxID=1176131 RepID=A0A6G1GKX1_9PEZI|nr:hypothetical protein K402DRAFT_415504 [Aulographum hederae CBS 113979]
MGNQNCHAEIIFDDGVKWLARLRLAWTISPPALVFDWSCGLDPTIAIGVDYILQAKLDGKPLDWPSARPEQREKIMQQLADVCLELEKHPFDFIGSLVTVDRNPASPNGHNSPYDIKVNTYLAHRSRLHVMEALFESHKPTDQFFLIHPDDKGDHILVNDAFDITGIIDWEWTRTASKAEAFSSPCMMWPVGKFYDGSKDFSPAERRFADIFRQRGRADLARYVEDGRKVQRFFFGLGTEGAYDDENTFAALFMGLRRTFGFEDVEWAVWKKRELERARDARHS